MLRKSRVPGWNWLLQRVSAIVLAVGLLVHFLVLHYTKMFGGRSLSASASTHGRFSGSATFWLVFDSILLAACLYHALNGTYNVVMDYNPRPGTRKVLVWFLWAVGLATFVLGLILAARFVAYAN